MSPYFSTRRFVASATCIWLGLNLYCMNLYVNSIVQCTERIIKSNSERTLKRIPNIVANHSDFLDKRPTQNMDRRHPELRTYSESSYRYNSEDEDGEVTKSNKDFVLDILVFSVNYGVNSRGFEITHTCGDQDIFVCFGGGYITEVVPEYDVVIFAGDILNDRNWDYLTEQREPRQIWIFASDVNPLKSTYILPPEGMPGTEFNMSFTYHSNSELHYSYGKYYPYTENGTISNTTDLFDEDEFDKKLVTWDSVDCFNGSWDRVKFVDELSKHIPVDIYGDCGNLKCRGNNSFHRKSPGSGGCQKVLNKYKFVLSLEDGCCSELLSNHFWNVLYHHKSVPVVVGASKEDYQRFAPPNSFIFAGDFKTVQELANYLLEVSSNRLKYNAFFEWQEMGSVKLTNRKEQQIHHKDHFCSILTYLDENYSKEQVMRTRVDPYGPMWRGGCDQCRQYDILKKYFDGQLS